MKKLHLMFAAGLLASSPLLLAQNADPATPATPATPTDEPATPATPATPADPSRKDGTKDPKVKKRATGAAATDDGSLGATANPDSGQGKAKGKADFAAFDMNGDGKLSKDEVQGDASINFKDLDKNSDGNVNRGEFEAGMKAKTPEQPKR